MPEENPNTQQGQVKVNPSRYNTNTTKGQDNGKSFDAQNDPNRNVEIDSAGLDRDEIDLDRSGVGTSKSNEGSELAPNSDESNENNQDLQASSDSDRGSGAVRGESGQSKTNAPSQGNQLNRNQDDSKLH